MSEPRTLGALCLTLLLAACASAPVTFYTLVPERTAAPAAPAGFAIAVWPIAVPEQVNIPEIVVRRSASQMALAESQQWIAPLGDEVRSALVSHLTQRLGASETYAAPAPTGLPLFRIQAQLRRFESVLDQQSRVELSWTVSRDAEPARLTCSSYRSVDVGGGYAALVEGHQKALSSIADDIADVVRNWAETGLAECA